MSVNEEGRAAPSVTPAPSRTSHQMPSGQTRAEGPSWHMVVVVNGELPAVDHADLRRELVEADQLVAVDGGLRHCASLEVWPTILIGDLDSAPSELIDEARSRDIAVHAFPVDKDATDLELAMDLALESGATAVTVVAPFGGRPVVGSRWRSRLQTASDTCMWCTAGARCIFDLARQCRCFLGTVTLLVSRQKVCAGHWTARHCRPERPVA